MPDLVTLLRYFDAAAAGDTDGGFHCPRRAIAQLPTLTSNAAADGKVNES